VDDYRPTALEWTFGPAEGSGLALDLGNNQQIVLRGMIDRVDSRTSADCQQFRIIDYKTGDTRVDPDTLFQGLALQLPAYLAAYAACHPGWQAADACYFHFDRPIFSLPGDVVPDPAGFDKKIDQHFKLRSLDLPAPLLAEIQAHTLDCIRRWSRQLLTGEYSARPRKIPKHKLACSYCQYPAVCGFDACFDPCEQLPALGGSDPVSGKRLTRKQDLIERLAARQEGSHEEGRCQHAAD
jgi:ATP-dependent helicase/DNAse subunit B